MGGRSKRSYNAGYMFFPPLIFFVMVVFFLVALVMLPFLMLGMIGEAFMRLGISPGLIFWLLILTLVGSLVNIPIYRFESREVHGRAGGLLFRHAFSGAPDGGSPRRPYWR